MTPEGLVLIPLGDEVYAVDAEGLVARGVELDDAALAAALELRLPPLLTDALGLQEVADLLIGVADTDFERENLRIVLAATPRLPSWRVGEALAEAFLHDHRYCVFPWPTGRDLKNPDASPAGTDLVGMQVHGDVCRFAFGEVKTSGQEKWPPDVMDGRHGLKKQLENLRDNPAVRNSLVLYLAFHAVNASWKTEFRLAASRYLADTSDVALFGVMIRDVVPDEKDLRNRAEALADRCPASTIIELRAVYLPSHAIDRLGQRADAATDSTP